MDFNNDFEDPMDQQQEQPQVPNYDQPEPQQQQGFGGQQGDVSNQQSTQQYSQQEQAQPQKDLGACGILKIEYYQPFFNVTSQEVISRVKTALIPTRPDFFEISRTNPDLWGPFWIYTSLIFIISAVGNIQAAFASHMNDNIDNFHFQYGYVPVAAILTYIIGFGTPLLLTVFMKCFGNQITVFQTICMYGYSMAVYVPIVILCLIPFQWAQWIFVSVGTAISIVFMIVNLQAEFSTYEQKRKYLMFGIIIGVQILFLFFLKLYFLKKLDYDQTHENIEKKLLL